MKAWMKLVSFALAAVVTVVLAMRLAAFLEQDACMDGGGRYVESTGACEAEGTTYVALFSRPNLQLLWAVFLGSVFLVGWLVYRGALVVFRRAASAQHAVVADRPKTGPG
jgi:hypothetical protein